MALRQWMQRLGCSLRRRGRHESDEQPHLAKSRDVLQPEQRVANGIQPLHVAIDQDRQRAFLVAAAVNPIRQSAFGRRLQSEIAAQGEEDQRSAAGGEHGLLANFGQVKQIEFPERETEFSGQLAMIEHVIEKLPGVHSGGQILVKQRHFKARRGRERRILFGTTYADRAHGFWCVAHP